MVEEVNEMKRAREAKAQFMSEDEIESALNEAMD